MRRDRACKREDRFNVRLKVRDALVAVGRFIRHGLLCDGRERVEAVEEALVEIAVDCFAKRIALFHGDSQVL